MEQFIEKYAFSVDLNMNDTFYYASADSEPVYVNNLPSLIEVEKSFGWIGVVAFVAVKRGHDPSIDKHKTKEFYNAKERIYELIKDKKIDTFDWNKESNDSLFSLGILPTNDTTELINWFHGDE